MGEKNFNYIAQEFGRAFLPIGLIFATSALIYLEYSGYPLLHATSLMFVLSNLMLGGLIAAAMVLISKHLRSPLIYYIVLFIFIDGNAGIVGRGPVHMIGTAVLLAVAIFLLRKHLREIVVAAFSVMALSTLVMMDYMPQRPSEVPVTDTIEQVGSIEDEALIIHLVLDAHIGIEGIPLDIPGGIETQIILKQLFSDFGFRLYGGAYSNHAATLDALPYAFNKEPMADINSLTVKLAGRHLFSSNTYLEDLSAADYEIEIINSDWLDLCGNKKVVTTHCHVLERDVIPFPVIVSLSALEGLKFVSAAYLSRFRAYVSVGTLFLWSQGLLNESRSPTDRFDVDLDVSPFPIISKYYFDKMILRIRQSRGRSVFYAHLIFPHAPFTYTANCTLKPPLWTSSTRLSNDDHSRAMRYQKYFEQVQCNAMTLRRLFDQLTEDGRMAQATIIVHGDHGSRLALRSPIGKNQNVMTARDLVDSFSTLFAIKRPDITPGYDRPQVSIRELIHHHLMNTENTPLAPQVAHGFLGSGDGEFVRILLPSFSEHLADSGKSSP